MRSNAQAGAIVCRTALDRKNLAVQQRVCRVSGEISPGVWPPSQTRGENFSVMKNRRQAFTAVGGRVILLQFGLPRAQTDMVSGGGAATSSANRERNMQFALARERFCLRRGFLIGSTALSAILSPLVAVAQIAPSTTPQGGVVVGGSASIAQAPGSTTINQSSERGAINWQSFDVGSAAKVQFNQPDAAAVTLNRQSFADQRPDQRQRPGRPDQPIRRRLRQGLAGQR